jgi:peptidoglycan-associated lipoprotein
MKKIQLSLVMLCAAVLTACSPRVAQPPPLDELEPPMEQSTVSDSLGYDPGAFADTSGSDVGSLEQYTGEQPILGRSSGDWVEDPALETVYFDYDQFQLKEDAMRTLNRNGQYLQRNPQLRVRVEGHCDERGTDQYNLALGENRSLSVREYLASNMGIDPNRIEVFSYGEYEPAVQGTDESAWRWNRRADFKVSQ